jgi:hypothetical protein
MKRFRLFCSILIFSLVFGCTSLLNKSIPFSLERPTECQDLLNRFDKVTDEAGVKDASTYPIPGFPYLRTNRFLSSSKKNLNESNRDQWLQLLQSLDLFSRRKEIDNLPDGALLSLGTGAENREKLFSRVRVCSSELLNHDKGQSEFYHILFPLVEVPDEYSLFMRTVGLYPLVTIPVAATTQKVRNKVRAWFEARIEDLPVDGKLVTFVPEIKVELSKEKIQEMIESSRKNPLGIPLLNKEQEATLASFFAPLFIQDRVASYDQIGPLFWRDDYVDVNVEDPTVYHHISHAFFKGKAILQINYVIWYSARAGERSPRIERGHLDGMTVRISLDPLGSPFMVDVINDCGCYHFFAPAKGRVEKIISEPLRFDPFVPQWLPEIDQGKRITIRINSGWHQVQRLLASAFPNDSIPYRLLPYDILEALPHHDGRTESIFNSSGIATGTRRVERYILFSMGIPSVGSMRQRGHHAIELVGREHFDDPDLFDKNFVFK